MTRIQSEMPRCRQQELARNKLVDDDYVVRSLIARTLRYTMLLYVNVNVSVNHQFI